MICPTPRMATLLVMIVLLIGLLQSSVAQEAKTSRTAGAGDTYRIAGTVVSKTDGHVLANARVTVSDTKNSQKVESVVTSEDGKYEFTGLPAGKYSLSARKRGFISAAYDQHEQFSTAIVTGAGLDTETLVLRLAPDAVLSGKVLDEAGEPVRHATVTVYFDDHAQGVSQIHPFRNAQTDDLGVFEITPLRPGTYFLSARAKPWYAIHRFSDATNPAGQAIDRSFDVAYPVTYYPDVTDADSAQPIAIQGGERLQVDIHLNPVAAIRLTFRVPGNENSGYPNPQLEQSAFDGATAADIDGVRMVSPGIWELTGIPAGRYNIRTQGPEGGRLTNGVDLSKDGEEVDTSKADAFSSVKVRVEVPGESSVPKELAVGLRSGSRSIAGWQTVDSKGEAELQNIPAGSYEFVVLGNRKRYSIAHVAAEGAEVSGRVLILTPGAAPSVSLRLVAGNVVVQGIAKKSGKGFAGAMVVLVPAEPKGNHDLFRRDQSDLDGTFSLPGIIPGSYTVLAIENGWDLDWSQPEVIAAYMKHGKKIEVGTHGTQTLKLPEPVEVQSK
jgi:uncharacterized GH25 family protein